MTKEVVEQRRNPSILASYAESKGLSGQAMYDTLAQTIFPDAKRNGPATAEQVNALLLVAQQHGLNPFTKEIWAFPAQGKGVVPIVSFDGWCKLMNNHPAFDGLHTEYVYDGERLVSCVAIVHRKDRAHPIRIEEDLLENMRNTSPWKQQPKRMLRHRAIIQAARIAFSFSGIYEPDEGERIVEAQARTIDVSDPVTAELAAAIEEPAAAETEVDEEPAPTGDAEPMTEAEMAANDAELFDGSDEEGGSDA